MRVFPVYHGIWRSNRLLALSGVCAPMVLGFSVVIATALVPGYSHRYDTISELARPGVPYPRILEAGFIAYGALMLPLGVALIRYLTVTKTHLLLFALFVAYSLALAGAGIFRDSSTWVVASGLSAGQLHDYLALAAYGAALGILLLTGWSVRDKPGWRPFAWFSLVSALIAGGFGLLFQLEHALGLGGLYQRGFCGATVLWVLVLSLRLIRATGWRYPSGERSLPFIPSGSDRPLR